ncbi:MULTISPECIES: phage major capsid protein, P2 family [Pseudomonas]|uniref:phage major capsid protein, P2 family n=1 Tax=Pseudomonas TaxID=286 RepID=UPI000863609A|nr:MULTISPECIES: phage major capsid protein, P2 family [Pseudomonas]MDV5384612.1 phage major capsid protein, P2 family [Pseudomonas juntendi]
MRNATRIAFTALAAQIALVNGVASATEKFNVAPTVQQTLEKATQESSAFLKAINIIGVDEQQGEALLAGVNGPVAGRTNTSAGNRRNPANVAEMSKDSYSCVQTNFDTSFPYALLDAWAKFPEFQVLLTNAIVERQALDRIMIGFNGKLVAVTTDRTANPLLQDVNKGWLQKIREGAADRVLDEGAVEGKIRVGATKIVKVAGVDTEISGDYQTLDGVVFDAIQMLNPWHRSRPDLVVLVSRDLMHDKLLKAVEKGAASNQEENAAQEIVSRARLGGLPVVDAPFLPAGTVLVTFLKNLSIYWQEGARRRHVKDEPEFDRIADYQSSNDAYVIEDFGAVALVENIEALTYPAPSET